jgi:signal transduction histidine kinase/CheY-like chemotaxis protein
MAFNPYRLTLASLIYPAWKHCLISVFRAGCLALLGHPWIALAWMAASCLTDIGMQRLVNAWDRKAAETGQSETPLRVAMICAFRATLYMSAPVLVAMQTHRAEDFLFMTLIAASMVAFSLSYGAFSKSVFWAMAVPPLAGLSAIGVTQLAPIHAAVVLASVAFTIVVMLMVWTTWRDAMAEWQRTHNASLDMIRDLRAARDRALTERFAADEAREVARRAGQAKANFLAAMSHEIRTPMNGVLGMAELLRISEKNPQQLERLEMLTESGEHLVSILDDILDMSRVESGRLDLAFETQDLRHFLDQVVAFCAGEAQAKGLELRLEADASLPRFVTMDPVRLRQVLFNLIGNAIKFTETGSITLSARAGEARARRVRLALTVADTGPGITADAMPHLFETFSQSEDAATRRFGGAGLGLAICKQMTELMGGRIRAESTPGEGARFHVDLVLELADARSTPDRDDDEVHEGRKLTVLAVDDNPVNLSVVEQMLALRQHTVVKASCGVEALELASKQAFDVVLMDIHMPGMSGIEALKALRALPGPNQATPVVAVTADVTSGGPERYLSLGFGAHTTKPLQPPRLFAVVDEALAAKPPQAKAKRA